jgi:IclR family transcriptional regulator, pca regulon regulatory protein
MPSGSNRLAEAGQGLEWSVPSLREPRYSQSLERGLAILGCFTPERRVLGIADIAQELGMSRSTTHRYVITLVALGYLEQGASRKYRLGLGVTNLGMSALNATALGEHAQPYLQELRRRVSYAVGLAVLDDTEIVYVDHAPARGRGQHKLDLAVSTGSRWPAHCTASGKILLAHLPTYEQRERIAGMALAKQGPMAITSKRALLGELTRAREEGFAVEHQELAPEWHAIAAPVRNESRDVVAAVDMTAHTSTISLDDLVEHLGPHLLSTADRIAARLGYRRDDEI